MSEQPPGANPVRTPSTPVDPEAAVDFEHPRGTLAIVVIFGVLFGLGWLAMYIFRFMAQGVPQH